VRFLLSKTWCLNTEVEALFEPLIIFIDSSCHQLYPEYIDRELRKSTAMQDKMLVDVTKVKEQAQLFAALADPTRLKLLHILCRQHPPGCRCVNNLSQLLGVSQPAVSQHLRVLKSAGLVIGEKRGFRMHYLIDAEGLKRCQGILSNTFEFTGCGEEHSCRHNCHPS
jgi:DNA-binding transcriptional ArsR family regulator